MHQIKGKTIKSKIQIQRRNATHILKADDKKNNELKQIKKLHFASDTGVLFYLADNLF